jgi:hypothetical protein
MRTSPPHRQPAGRKIVSDKAAGHHPCAATWCSCCDLQREKLYAAINIAGLSLGIACCLILGLFLRSELTCDRYHEYASQIYRVVNEFTINGKADRFR